MIIAEAHFYNLAHPGSFSARVNQLLEFNNFLKVKLPNDAPSAEEFNIINRNPECARTEPDEDESDDSDEMVEVDRSPQAVAVLPIPDPPRGATETKKQPQQPAEKSQKQHTKSEHSVRPIESSQEQHRQSQQPARLPEQSQTSQQQTKQQNQDIGLEFFTYERSGILETMAPDQLFQAIRQQKVKFTYREPKIMEQDILRYIRDGTLSTKRNKIQIVDQAIYKKIRTGLISRSPVESTAKHRHKFSSQ